MSVGSRGYYIELTEEYLKSYEGLKNNLELLKREREDLASIIATLPSPQISDIKVQRSTNISSVTEQNAIKLVEQKILLDIKIRNNENFIRKIETALNSLENTDRKIINMNVIENKNWKYISQKLHYSERQLRDRKQKALTDMTITIFGCVFFEKTN